MAKKNKQENAGGSPARSPESAPAWAAFDRGNYRQARREARALLAGSAPEPAKEDARDILARTNLEKGTLLALLGLGAVIAGVIVALVLRGG